MEVISSNEETNIDVPAWAEKVGHTYLGTLKEDGALRILSGGTSDRPFPAGARQPSRREFRPARPTSRKVATSLSPSSPLSRGDAP